MKKKILSALLVMALTISIFGFIMPTKAGAGINLYSDPPGKTALPTDVWAYNIKLENATKVIAIGLSLHFDPAYVNITTIEMGGCLGPAGALMIAIWNPTTGYIEGITYGILVGSYDVPDGIALIITVEAIDFVPSTVIDIYDVEVYDEDGYLILEGDSPYDYTVEIPTPPPTNPTAKFTYSPPYPKTDETVTFDASTSTSGFDGTDVCPITEYRWDWENDGIVDDVTGVPVKTHIFTAEATYSVNLTVYAPPGPSPDISYNPYASVVHDVMVTAPALGRVIDLYTQNWRHPGYLTDFTGEGTPSGTQVDSYAPQDLVILCAKVTFNLEPVANKEVAFAIQGPENQYQNITIYRQNSTNADGVACISFRIPWPDEHAKDIVFGEWTIMAKVDIAEEWVEDYHWFLVGWIIEIQGVELYDWLNTIRVDFEELQNVFINTTIYNLAMTPRNVTITIVIYDALGVPIGTAVTKYSNVPPGETELDRVPILVSINIPEWAYVGFGMVYVNAFTKLPWDCGVCYCPEFDTAIQIKPGP
jgi:hypothetical protein